MTWISVLAAVLAAFCLALGSERQSTGVRRYGGTRHLGPRAYLRLAHSGAWLGGGALLLVGTGLNVFALATAPLTVVQPIGAIAVVITALLYARLHHVRLNRTTVLAIAACVTGSAGFVVLAIRATEENPAPGLAQERLTAWIAFGAVLVFGVLAVLLRNRPTAIVYVVGAGVLYGFVAVCVRLASIHVLRGDAGGFLGIPWLQLAIMAAAGLLGIYFVQSAYQHGPPDLVVAGLTVIDPLVGVLIGILVLGEVEPGQPAWVGLSMGLAALVATLGVVALARSRPDVAARREADRTPDATT